MTGIEHYQPRQWLSISSLVSFSRCPRKYFYSSGCRLGSPNGPHPALTFGQAIHKAHPQLLIGEDKTKIERALKDFSSIWTSEVDAQAQDKKRNINVAYRMLLDFYQGHSNGRSIYELVEPPKSNLIIAEDTNDFEVPFAIDIGLRVPLVGRIDALVRHRDSKKLWALEWKTASEVSQRFLEGFQRSPQCLAYCLALRVLTQEPVEGTMVEGLLVSTSRNLTQLIPVPALDHHIENFIKWATLMGGLLLECERLKEFPQHFTGCGPYSQFGMPGFSCEFGNLCDVPDWTRLKSLYATSEDRPFILAQPSNGSKGLSLHQLSQAPIESTLQSSEVFRKEFLNEPPAG